MEQQKILRVLKYSIYNNELWYYELPVLKETEKAVYLATDLLNLKQVNKSKLDILIQTKGDKQIALKVNSLSNDQTSYFYLYSLSTDLDALKLIMKHYLVEIATGMMELEPTVIKEIDDGNSI